MRDRNALTAVWVLLATVLCPASLWAQVNPVNDFFAGFSAITVEGGATGSRQTLVGWQVSASQKIKSAEDAATKRDTPISIVGDFGRQSGTYEYMGGVRARAGSLKRRTSVFTHALLGGTTRRGDTRSGTGLMMGYGGGLDMTTHPSGPAYDLGARVQFDWLPSRVNGAWGKKQFRIAVGIVFMARYWD